MWEQIRDLDPANMLGDIQHLPQQMETAWEWSRTLPLPETREPIRRVVLAGMGGSAIGADLLASWLAPRATLPIVVWRDYDLPGWAAGPETLVVASSHSGNTEETLSAFFAGLERGCVLVAISRGGQLGRAAQEKGVPWWRFEHHGQPRAAVGFGFVLPLALLFRLGLLPQDPEPHLREAIQAMREQQAHLEPDIPTPQNPAKRLAGQLMGRLVSVFGAQHLAPVARRWKSQMNELAKAWAQFEVLPEADHNTLAGIHHPEALFATTLHLFLDAPSLHPRNRKRVRLTRQVFMEEGLNTEIIEAHGETALAHQWTLLHLGDYIAYYLALHYHEDPTPVTSIEGFKKRMARG